MLVLLTNDDGIYAPGLLTLAKALLEIEDIELVVAAPEGERSACGHAVTVYTPLHAKEVELPELSVRAWAVSGTPADCVKLGAGALTERRPDVVVSGINRGANLAMDIFYSGTVSAAIEGAIQGLPAIAVSVAAYDDANYGPAAAYAARVARVVGESSLPTGTLLNVNVPAVPADQIAGVEMTEMGVTQAKDQFEKRVDPRGRTYFWLKTERVVDGWSEKSDVMAIRRNMISVTPLQLDLGGNAAHRVQRHIVLPSLPWEEVQP